MEVPHRKIEPKVLNDTVWATIKPSKIHGVGVFAIRDIPAGQKIFAQGWTGDWIRTDLGLVDPEIRKLIVQRWPTEVDGLPYLSPNDDAILVSFMNHSDKPNYGKLTDTALRKIKKGEEITEDYGKYKKIVEIK